MLEIPPIHNDNILTDYIFLYRSPGYANWGLIPIGDTEVPSPQLEMHVISFACITEESKFKSG
jgi:hypothetical protein